MNSEQLREKFFRLCAFEHKTAEEAIAEINVSPTRFLRWMSNERFARRAKKLAANLAKRRELTLMFAAAEAAEKLLLAAANRIELSAEESSRLSDLVRLRRDMERLDARKKSADVSEASQKPQQPRAHPDLPPDRVKMLLDQLRGVE